MTSKLGTSCEQSVSHSLVSPSKQGAGGLFKRPSVRKMLRLATLVITAIGANQWLSTKSRDAAKDTKT